MSRFSDINKILNEEPEEWLAYLYGQQLDNLKHLREAKPRVSGMLLHSAAFFYHALRAFQRSIFTTKAKTVKVEFYLYAGSANQANSLAGTAKALKLKNKMILANSNNIKLLNNDDCSFKFDQLKVQLSDVALALLLFVSNAPALYKRLKDKDSLLVKNFFKSFCLSYFYLLVFYRTLKRHKPSYVLVSNDHNVDCRCLIAAATALGIKTVYMQHASVSEVFPALTVDYAFLDGQSALDTYRKCKNNVSPTRCAIKQTKVFLSGQKKLLRPNNNAPIKVGMAINPLDEIDKVIKLINILLTEGFTISLRWHPRQANSDVVRLKKTLASSCGITLSDPKVHPLNEFLSEIYTMICGNSSIHLEAAVAGVLPVYYEIQPPAIKDYYGYVKKGLALKIDTFQELIALLRSKPLPNSSSAAIQYYSATYDTDWYGREGELVASILLDIEDKKTLGIQFGKRDY